MRRNILLALSFITLLNMPSPVSAAWHEPYKGSRIFWDNATRKTVFTSGGYARIIQLHDGRLMATCERNGIVIAFSSDKGSTWSSPTTIVNNMNNVPNCVPDLIQLADGTIVVGYNPRPNTPYTEDRRFGIRCKRSTDNGKTWSDEIFVNDASNTFSDGCWEPSFLELPSGELQLYFADEGPYTRSNEQQISMCRSFDKGQTWTAAQKVSFRAGSRDGMPSAIILQDGKTIALAFEDNGWAGVNNFIPTVVTCPLATNWNNYWVDANSSYRWKAVNYDYSPLYRGGAPYLRKLPWGETIISHQGENGNGADMSKLQMWVYVGNEQAKDFKAMSEPFGSDNSLWNSLAVIDTGTVVAVGGMDGHIDMIKGRAVRQLEAPYAHPTIDGKQTSKEGYYMANATQLLLGHSSNKVRFTADFAYDNDSLYFTSRVSDVTQHPLPSSYGDGVTLFLDTDYASDEQPVDNIHRLFFRLDGTVVAYQGSSEKRRWMLNSSIVDKVHSVLKRANKYYIVEAAIPWSALGFNAPPVGQLMRANVMLHDNRDGSNNVVYDMMPDAKRDASWTWIDLALLSNPDATSVNGVEANKSVSVTIGDTDISISSPIAKATIYTIAGGVVAEYTTSSFAKPASKGVYLLSIILKDGNVLTRKFLVK